MELAASHTPVAGAIRQAWGLATSVNALIVDDNEGIRRLLRRAIREIADPIWECCDGADALKSYIDRRPDIVLMDFSLPDGTGLDATRAILDELPDCKIIFLTVYETDENMLAAIHLGAQGGERTLEITVGGVAANPTVLWVAANR